MTGYVAKRACTDTDGGIMPNDPGTVTATSKGYNTVTKTDSCVMLKIGNNVAVPYIREYYCGSNPTRKVNPYVYNAYQSTLEPCLNGCLNTPFGGKCIK